MEKILQDGKLYVFLEQVDKAFGHAAKTAALRGCRH
jgi:hypothetical protein